MLSDTRYHDLLKQQLFAFHPLPDDAWEALKKPWAEVTFRRKELITRCGDTERYLYLVLEGVQRAYCLHNGRDFTLVFSYPYSFSGIVDSFLLRQPSGYHLEAITTSRMLRIAAADFERLLVDYPSISTWVRIAVTQVLAATLRRQTELAAYTAEEKFTALLQRSPHVLNLIPHKYLASYIGVDPTNFSKLLGSVKL
jgi:CRP-like cAMP-binding protein